MGLSGQTRLDGVKGFAIDDWRMVRWIAFLAMGDLAQIDPVC